MVDFFSSSVLCFQIKYFYLFGCLVKTFCLLFCCFAQRRILRLVCCELLGCIDSCLLSRLVLCSMFTSLSIPPATFSCLPLGHDVQVCHCAPLCHSGLLGSIPLLFCPWSSYWVISVSMLSNFAFYVCRSDCKPLYSFLSLEL